MILDAYRDPNVGIKLDIKVLLIYLVIMLVFPTPDFFYIIIPDSPRRTTLHTRV